MSRFVKWGWLEEANKALRDRVQRTHMSRGTKISVVIAGYVMAIVAGIVAARLYDMWAAQQPFDTSGGMYAAGQTMQSLGAFLVVALMPTGMMLWFLRRHEGFWNVVAWGSLAFAAVGLLAVLVTMVLRATPAHVVALFVSLLGLAQLLGVPLWFVVFVLFAILAPTRKARQKLVLAIGIELVIGVCAFVRWFVLSPPL